MVPTVTLVALVSHLSRYVAQLINKGGNDMTEEQAERLIEALQNIQVEMKSQSKDISYIASELSEIVFQLKIM